MAPALIARALVGPRDPIRLDTFRVVTGISLVGFEVQWWLDVDEDTLHAFHRRAVALGRLRLAGASAAAPPPA